MQNKSMDGELLTSIRTVQEQRQTLEQIDLLLNGLNNKEGIDNITFIGKEIYEHSKKADNAQQFLETIKKSCTELPVVRITLVFQPTDKQITDLSMVTKSAIHKSAVLDIHIDSFLIAGALVEYNGEYFDGSLASKFI